MASDIFVKLGDIKGETLDSKHKDEIEVFTFAWGVSNQGLQPAGSGAGQGKANFSDITFTHGIDKASPALMQACATGTHFKDATITHRKAGKEQHEYLIYKLTDVIVTSVSHGTAANEIRTQESVSLAFAKVAMEYRPQKADGSLDAGVFFKYDIKGNKVG